MARKQNWFDRTLPLAPFTEDNLSENDRISGYRIDRPGPHGKGLVAFSPQVNRALRDVDRLPSDFGDPWKLRGTGLELLPFAIFRASSKGITFDAAKVRLGTD